jgi:hypothetical protein
VLQFEAWFEVEEQKQKKEKGKRKKTFDLRRLRHGLRTRPPSNRELYRNNRRS